MRRVASQFPYDVDVAARGIDQNASFQQGRLALIWKWINGPGISVSEGRLSCC
jgi:hypothetical protein